MIRHIELITDNRGGFTLQVGKTWRHRYDSARQVADDLLGLVAGEHPLRDWQGVLPVILRANGGRYRWHKATPNEADMFPCMVCCANEEHNERYRWYEGTPGTVMAAVVEDRLSGCGWQSVYELADILSGGHAAD